MAQRGQPLVSQTSQQSLGASFTIKGLYEKTEPLRLAAARQIPSLMSEFEKEPLRKYTPCLYSAHKDIVKAIAVVHTELVLIHPFREGNGRVARILSALMALQAGLPSLNFSVIKGKQRKGYFAAVRAGMDKNYEPMEKIFNAVISRTLRIQKG